MDSNNIFRQLVFFLLCGNLNNKKKIITDVFRYNLRNTTFIAYLLHFITFIITTFIFVDIFKQAKFKKNETILSTE